MADGLSERYSILLTVSCASSFAGERSDISAPQPGGESLPSAVLAVALQRSVLGTGLSSCGLPHHTYWSVCCLLPQCLPCCLYLLKNVLHLDRKADNMMFGVLEDSVFTDLEEKEFEHPVARKEVDAGGRTIYMSRELRLPRDRGRAGLVGLWLRSSRRTRSLGVCPTQHLPSTGSHPGGPMDVQRGHLERGMHGKTKPGLDYMVNMKIAIVFCLIRSGTIMKAVPCLLAMIPSTRSTEVEPTVPR